MSPFRFRILFVDDEPSVRNTGAAVLRTAGYEVLTAEDGLEGLHNLDEALPDLIISDLRMPRMSGFEFLAVVRNRFPQIPTIALSGEYVTDIPEGLLADTFLQKGSYSVPELLRTIKEFLKEPPPRQLAGTRNTSPIWVAVNGSGQVIVTCPKCLRSFDVSPDQTSYGTHTVACSSCNNQFAFNIDRFSALGLGHGRTVEAAVRSTARKKQKARPVKS